MNDLSKPYPYMSVQRHNNTIVRGVFMPLKNRKLETCSRDYATVDEAVFSPCRAEPRSAVP
jgi:hypothetical protein